MAGEPHDRAREELARIDFLLDELARAVERGEVHRASYDLMAPRHLERRADLVALITGVPRPVAERASDAAPPDMRVQLPSVPAVPPGGPHAFDGSFSAESPGPGAVRRPAAPVDWTTVLLFLGAFLVIVAAAIFSVAVWRDLGAGAKVAFMGALTAGFYVAGWWARARMRLAVGAVALTAVASTMLLFVGWIAIDGYGLAGPLPWAVWLLVCSVVYWFTETRLESRFFGVLGATAQIAWWWLLGAGLGLPAPTRLAGLALVALGWHLVARRVSPDSPASSLARVLEVAAPVLAAGATAALLVDIAFLGSADGAVVAAAAVTSACAGLIAAGTRFVGPAIGSAGAALAQVPVLVSAWAATADAGDSWWVFGVFAAAALVYYVLGLGAGGAALLVAGLAAEGSAVLELCRVLGASDATTLLALAALAAVWSLTARLAPKAETLLPPRRSTLLATAAETGAWALLAGVSLGLPAVTGWAPFAANGIGAREALPYLGVLAAWCAAVLACPRGAAAWAGSVWAHVTVLALLSWGAPDSGGHVRAAALVVLAGAWLAASRLWGDRYGAVWRGVGMWSARIVVIGLAALGTVAALLVRVPPGAGVFGADRLWDPVVLLAAAFAVLLADAIVSGSRVSSAAAGAALSTAVALAADAAVSVAETRVVATAAVAVSVGAAALAWRRYASQASPEPHASRAAGAAPWAAGAATAGAIAWIVASQPPAGTALAAAWLIVSAALALLAALTVQPVTFLAGGAVIASVLALLGDDPEPAAFLAVLAALGLSLSSASLWAPLRPGARLGAAGLGLAGAGVLAHVVMVASGPLQDHALATGLLVLAANTAVVSARYRFEPGYYAAGAPVVSASWVETGMLSAPPAVLLAVPAAVYVAACGYLHVRLAPAEGPERRFPEALDVVAVLIGLGYPLLVALGAPAEDALREALGVVAFSLLVIGAGIVLKVRAYFFGGVAALAAVAFYRSFYAIAQYWWLVLGFVGVGLLVIALSWERQRMLVADTRERLRRSFEGWR